MDIDFSIVVPTLNSEKYLPETINSIKQQNKSVLIELIFSDGGSVDDTLNIIKSFEQSNISKVILLNKIGLSNAINEGLKVAKGKYISYLNSDDLLDKNALVKIKEKFINNKKMHWHIGFCQNVGNKVFTNKFVNLYKRYLLNKLSFNILCINNIISQPSVFWRKEFYTEVGKFDENLKFNMDYDMWIRMFLLSKPEISNFKVSYFRRHASSLSHKNTLKQFKEKFKTMRKYNKNLSITILHLIVTSLILLIYKITNY